MKKIKRFVALSCAVASLAALSLPMFGCSGETETVVLRVSNWEEYIDLGGWEEDELIDIDSYADTENGGIIGVNSMVDDFTEWFNSTHDFDVRVEYSTFGTNEDLYNRLSLGDVYDLVCPSDYMIMKLLAENEIVGFSDKFMDETIENNYYAKYVSPFIDCDENSIFNKYGWNGLAAGYMWGSTGFVYNPEKLNSNEDVATMKILQNKDYFKQITVKDNVRDSYFAALGAVYSDELLALTDSVQDDLTRTEILNKKDDEAIEKAQAALKDIKENAYSFETDSGKSDMVTGKVIANYQWSGDAVYIMDEADAEDTELWYSVPDECTNLWFDGWVMLKDGISGNAQKQVAAEAFVNFLSKPENAIRNMYYIGYTSTIAGEEVFEYMGWNYEAGDEAEEIYDYDLSYFFGDGHSVAVDGSQIEISEDGSINRGRQLFAQYPTSNVIARSVVMQDFGERLGAINKMWINVRCPDLVDFSPVSVIIFVSVAVLITLAIVLYSFRRKIFISYKPKKGYKLKTDN